VATKRVKDVTGFLARQRTLLASERTLLAYWRTALTAFGIALIVLKFFTQWTFITSGIFMIIALVLLIHGTKSYANCKKKINGHGL